MHRDWILHTGQSQGKHAFVVELLLYFWLHEYKEVLLCIDRKVYRRKERRGEREERKKKKPKDEMNDDDR